MKYATFCWVMVAAAAIGQQTDTDKKFYADFAKSEQQAISDYPDAAKADSPISKKMIEIDKALNSAGDPLYYSPCKPYIIAQRAASALGIAAGGNQSPATTQSAPQPAATGKRSAEWMAKKDEAWRQLQDYYPEYCYPLNLNATYAFVTKWDAWAKVNRPDVYDNPRKPIIYCGWQKAEDNKAAAMKAEAAAEVEREQPANPPIVAQAPVWKRFVQNEEFTKANREDIADEIRRQDGDAAAERFVTDERLKDLEEAKNESEAMAIQPPLTRHLEGGNYQRRGDRITVNGDLSGGYRIKGNRLYSFQSGAATHTRSGNMWIPMDSSQPQIRDPER
jgi:hypothetical protein